LRVGASKSRKVRRENRRRTNNRCCSTKFVPPGRFPRRRLIPSTIIPVKSRRWARAPRRHPGLGASFPWPTTQRWPDVLSRSSPECRRSLVNYSGPVSTRLENVIERSVVMSGAEVHPDDAFALEGNIESTPESEDPGEPNETLASLSRSRRPSRVLPRRARRRQGQSRDRGDHAGVDPHPPYIHTA